MLFRSSVSSRRPSRFRNSDANCSSLMYFRRVNSENRSVRSSRSESLSTISTASMFGALTSLSHIDQTAITNEYWKSTYLSGTLSRIFFRRFSSVTSSSVSSRRAKRSGLSGIRRFIHSCFTTSWTAYVGELGRFERVSERISPKLGQFGHGPTGTSMNSKYGSKGTHSETILRRDSVRRD